MAMQAQCVYYDTFLAKLMSSLK